mmetsp:Transcript_6326/g.9601  ORF Transcript_6326/g.9601 Transcript_6326/m.9601 type:complete len:81 (+) Transcript_6326:423-665(+)
MNTIRHIFMVRVGDDVFLMRKLANKLPGMVERSETSDTSPHCVPLNFRTSIKNVTATVVNADAAASATNTARKNQVNVVG